ncbi:MAG: efflux RND transporter periplasmic adaptor subunit [Deltaproteobacteria bacterium]|nr:efflux RND transporter periplasmic adaptor subunit [Deltaproteobacteria bacterium]
MTDMPESNMPESNMPESNKPESVDMTITNDKRWLRRLLPIVVLIVGAAIAVAIVKSKKKPKRKKPVAQGTLVKVMVAKRARRRVMVRSQGTVQPKRQLVISPEVPGKVRWVNPGLVVGGLIKKGAVLLRIDPVDYVLAAERAKAQIAQAERGLAEAQSNAQVARREWKILGKSAGVTPTDLTLGKPQLKQAKASMAAAKADLKQAQVRCGRTVLRAPFDLRVRVKHVEAGQYVTPGMQLATVFGTARAEVIVPLKVDELRWIDVPKLRFGSRGIAKKKGRSSTAWVQLRMAGKTYKRRGEVDRSVGEIDPSGRMARVVITIDDPYNLKTSASKENAYQADFEMGAFVEVAIEGRWIDDVIPLPAEAVRIGSVVWVATKDNTLDLHKVTIARLTEKEALIASGLKAGERVILTPLASPLEGLRLRILGDSKPKPLPVEKPKSAQAAKVPGTSSSHAGAKR